MYLTGSAAPWLESAITADRRHGCGPSRLRGFTQKQKATGSLAPIAEKELVEATPHFIATVHPTPWPASSAREAGDGLTRGDLPSGLPKPRLDFGNDSGGFLNFRDGRCVHHEFIAEVLQVFV